MKACSVYIQLLLSYVVRIPYLPTNFLISSLHRVTLVTPYTGGTPAVSSSQNFVRQLKGETYLLRVNICTSELCSVTSSPAADVPSVNPPGLQPHICVYTDRQEGTHRATALALQQSYIFYTAAFFSPMRRARIRHPFKARSAPLNIRAYL